MKKTFLLLVAIISYAGVMFGQADYQMIEIMYLKPQPGKMKELTKGMGEHNKKFHSAEGPYGASVWSCDLGLHYGQLAWVMGPCTFTDLDGRPSGKEHDDDWNANVEPYMESTGMEYWRFDKDHSYLPANFKPGTKLVWTVYDIKPFEGYRFKAMCDNIVEVYKAKNYTFNFQVFWNQFDSKEGRDAAIEVDFEKWAFLDRDDNFKKDYEEVHGEGSFQHLLDEYKDVVISANDELIEYMPEMSGVLN